MYSTSIQNFISDTHLFLLKNKKVRLENEIPMPIDGKNRIFDSILYNNNEILAVFEYKNQAEKIEPKDFYTFFAPFNNSSFKYLVISTGLHHKVLNRHSDEVREFYNIKSLFDFLLDTPSQKDISQTREEIIKTIRKLISDFFKKPELKGHSINQLKSKITNHFSKESLKKNLFYDKNGQFFQFSKDIRDLGNFENSFFKLLIEEMNTNQLFYRYTILETAFSTIKHNSIRLNGIAGMNDISEVGYVERYLDDTFIPMEKVEDVDQINNRFILCGSVLNDDLMQWRLYGNDCKGICLAFKIKSTNSLSGLQLRKISYGIELNGENYHPELELISEIINAVKEFDKQSLQFRTLSIWKHFFKSFEYSPEQEVRLLIILSKNKSIKGEQISASKHEFIKDWCITSSHQIINPYITISLNDATLPIELNEIILGPKCPEISINKKQFEQLLRENINVKTSTRISRIKNYR